MSRRLMLKNASGGFEPIVGTLITLNSPGVYYVTALESVNGGSGNGNMAFYPDVGSAITNITNNRRYPRACMITIDSSGIVIVLPYIDQWSQEVTKSCPGASSIEFCAGWSGKYGTNTELFRVDIDESRWGVLE